ncbi:hypothetical protein BB560_001700 [Smittium megazygosporum]|uniref:HMA domain-containing protein n=1 Tax=Smittium megazygosporum TaxID=133381 RepID=A0A2T9ZGV7_9FUNG|nr:hypothetical protein BB560_001700 [Smittium megazygosporum]
MTCQGCSNAVKRALSRENITEVDIDMDNQIVTVKTDRDGELVYSTIVKTGKKTEKMN